jgi:hypothetical protein
LVFPIPVGATTTRPTPRRPITKGTPWIVSLASRSNDAVTSSTSSSTEPRTTTVRRWVAHPLDINNTKQPTQNRSADGVDDRLMFPFLNQAPQVPGRLSSIHAARANSQDCR